MKLNFQTEPGCLNFASQRCWPPAHYICYDYSALARTSEIKLLTVALIDKFLEEPARRRRSSGGARTQKPVVKSPDLIHAYRYAKFWLEEQQKGEVKIASR